jgi:hypothetical protein
MIFAVRRFETLWIEISKSILIAREKRSLNCPLRRPSFNIQSSFIECRKAFLVSSGKKWRRILQTDRFQTREIIMIKTHDSTKRWWWLSDFWNHQSVAKTLDFFMHFLFHILLIKLWNSSLHSYCSSYGLKQTLKRTFT